MLSSSSSSSSWPDVVVPALLIIAWLFISPLPLQLIKWIRLNSKISKDDSSTYSASNSIAKREEISSGYILPVLIHHARILPKESQHSFRYPSLFLALNLNDLERGDIQLNRVFSYTPLDKRWSLSKLDPDGFGRRSFPGIDIDSKKHQQVSKSILLKLLYELRLRKYTSVGPQDVDDDKDLTEQSSKPWDKEVGQVWAVAMPTLLGLGGFNPLTVYYVCRPEDQSSTLDSEKREGLGKLWLVVLEVHNTFNERHVYVCQVGVEEDGQERRRKDYQHSWTFAREFHVSPFNDRLGYYQLLMNDLWFDNDDGQEASSVPMLDVRLLLLSPDEKDDDDDGEKEADKSSNNKPKKLNKKLLATLMSSQAKSNSLKPVRKGLSMTRKNMLHTLAKQPFDLVLPVSRIMWEAAKLHWKKGLPVFIRPEQRGQGLDEEQLKERKQKQGAASYNGLEWPVDQNPTQISEKKVTMAPSSGSIYWNQDTFLERACQLQFQKYAQQHSTIHDDTCLIIQSRNAEVQPSYFYKGKIIASLPSTQKEVRHFSIYTLSSSFYLDFALYTPTQARLFGSLMDRNWGVSSVEDFEMFFSPHKGSAIKIKKNWRMKMAMWARQSHMQWAIYQGVSSPSKQKKEDIANQLIVDVCSNHPYNSIETPFSFLLALLLHILIIRLTAALSALLHIHYVRAPWIQVAEGYQKLLQEAQ